MQLPESADPLLSAGIDEERLHDLLDAIATTLDALATEYDVTLSEPDQLTERVAGELFEMVASSPQESAAALDHIESDYADPTSSLARGSTQTLLGAVHAGQVDGDAAAMVEEAMRRNVAQHDGPN
jgi:hypothetical protein